MVSLILVSGGDIASTNQADELLKLCDWQEIGSVEGMPAYSYKHARMWWVKDGCLWEDDLDKRWHKATGENPSEVIFPSRPFCRKRKRFAYTSPNRYNAGSQ